jgi:hypothetical protein
LPLQDVRQKTSKLFISIPIPAQYVFRNSDYIEESIMKKLFLATAVSLCATAASANNFGCVAKKPSGVVCPKISFMLWSQTNNGYSLPTDGVFHNARAYPSDYYPVSSGMLIFEKKPVSVCLKRYGMGFFSFTCPQNVTFAHTLARGNVPRVKVRVALFQKNTFGTLQRLDAKMEKGALIALHTYLLSPYAAQMNICIYRGQSTSCPSQIEEQWVE